MHCHGNARLTPRGRARVFAAVEGGMTVAAACLAFGISRRTYYRWLPRWRASGVAGLVDRSSRPRRSPQRLSPADEAAIATLREASGWGPDRIAATLGLARSSVHRAIVRLGLGRAPVPRQAVVRYTFGAPGGLVHLDTKRLGRIGAGPGHRATGDRRSRHRGIGWEILHVALDDATRLVYAELLPDERGRTTARFLVRALRWFRAQGVTVRRLLTDNGSPYLSRPFRRACRILGLRHSRTRPYRPQTNGKVERWIRTVLSECLYREVFHAAAERAVALAAFIGYYNTARPHLALDGQTPALRLSVLLAA